MTLSRQDDGGARFAIYWAPPDDSALARIGGAWLGRDAATNGSLPRPTIKGFDPATLAAVTAEPRRYGLHATLKPPFRLVGGLSAAALEAELAAFAALAARAIVPPVRVTRIGSFIALAPAEPAVAVSALANACVERFDRYRAPPAAEELARRRTTGLTARQNVHLRRWGYPFVMDEFRFHVTLTGPIVAAVADDLLPALARLFAPVTEAPLELHDIALFMEAAPGAPFRLLRRFALGRR